MQRCEKQKRSRNNEDVQGKEARQRSARNDRTAQQQMDQATTYERYAAGDGGANPKAPVGVLIKAQDLTGKRHAQGHEQEEHAEYPSEFTRKLVGSKQEDLCHMH